MGKRTRKTIKIILAIVLFLIAGYFVVNGYLNHRIEAILKRELGKAVSNASDGFYRLSFDHLSVGFFNGELSIKGVELVPDSTIFKDWEAKDSLPQVYYKIKVGAIDFKGVNLAWSFNYKDLKFGLFEIKNTRVDITSAYSSSRYKSIEAKNKSQLDLYEMISPYISSLSVGKINLENITVLYTVEDPVLPSLYGLKEINFVAYDFLLDENSSQSGKLLLCDDFEFVVDRPQTLLSDSHFTLNADSIRLSTKDSLIQISGIHLKPQEDDWENRTVRPGNYVDAEVKSVAVKGAFFKREEGLNYLQARSFEIKTSDIEFYTVNKRDSIDKRDEAIALPDDTIDTSWSLYSIISPLLHSVLIQEIGVDDTSLKYYVSQGRYTDSYTMDNFSFRANKFWVDSLVDTRNQFWHSESYILEAREIKGDIPSKNVKAGLEHFLLNTIDGQLKLSGMNLAPVSTNTWQDYVTGTIRFIDITGLLYKEGLEANRLEINSPKVKYFRMSEFSKKSARSESKTQKSQGNIIDLFAPYVEYLRVRNIDLNNADLAFYDRVEDNTYQLKDFNFYATDFLIDEHTRRTQRYMFDCGNFGFSFKDFDNYLQGKDYRLLIKKGGYSYRSGQMVFEDVRLMPQTQSWEKAPDTYYDLTVPKIDIRGIDFDLNRNLQDIKLGEVSILSPQVKVVKTAQSSNRKKAATKGQPSVIQSLAIDSFNIRKADLLYLDRTVKDSLHIELANFGIGKLNWEPDKDLSIGGLMLQSPNIYYVSENKPAKKPSGSKQTMAFPNESINIGRFSISNINVDIKQPDMVFHADTKSFGFTDMKWSIENHAPAFAVNTVDVEKPVFRIHQLYMPDETRTEEDGGSDDLYTLLDDYVSRISVGKFNLSGASLDYTHSLNGVQSEQQTTSTNNLLVENMVISPKERSMNVGDLKYSANDIRFPLNEGFYTMAIGTIYLDKNKGSLKVDDIHLIPFYAKERFAYEHPRHKDWFDVSARSVSLYGIDFNSYFTNKLLKAKTLNIEDVMFQNFKNQKIEIQHNIMPMIYEGLQNIPIDYFVDKANIKNFNVTYEELTKGGTTPGKIFFTDMNGTLTGLTNVADRQDQFIRLDTDGKFMGAGYYKGIWMLPVSKDYDCFLLEILVDEFDLKHLNQIFTPMASAEVKSGVAKKLGIMMEASSEGGTIGMSFLYNDLKVNVLRNSDLESKNSFMSFLANLAIKSNNPDKKGKDPRRPEITIVRDKYHSTFNYLWQMLQPATVESVGVSQGKQNFAKRVAKIFAGIKNFFAGGNKKDKQEDKPSKD